MEGCAHGEGSQQGLGSLSEVRSQARVHPQVWSHLFPNRVEQADGVRPENSRMESLIGVVPGTLFVLISLPSPSEEVLGLHESSQEPSCGAQRLNTWTP